MAKNIPWWLSDKESTSQCRRPGFDLWVRKIPWRRIWQTHSSILAWKIQWTEEPGRLQSMGCKESDTQKLNNSKEYMANHLGKNVS